MQRDSDKCKSIRKYSRRVIKLFAIEKVFSPIMFSHLNLEFDGYRN